MADSQNHSPEYVMGAWLQSSGDSMCDVWIDTALACGYRHVHEFIDCERQRAENGSTEILSTDRNQQLIICMDILYLMIPLSLLLVVLIVGGAVWAVLTGQFDDLDSPAHRILDDDDEECWLTL